MLVYIVGPAATIALYKGFEFRRPPNTGVTVGDPFFEAAGVLNRRGAFCYPFTVSQMVELWMRIVNRGDQNDLTPRYQVPPNWRYPTAQLAGQTVTAAG